MQTDAVFGVGVEYYEAMTIKSIASITSRRARPQPKQVFVTKPAINTFKRPDRQFITNPPTGHITKLNWQISALYPKLMNSV